MSRRSRRNQSPLQHTGIVAALTVLAVVGCESDTRLGDAGPVTLAAADVHVLGTSTAIAEVRDLAALPDGSTWVLNSVPPFFVGFDGEGELIDAYGSAGGGPEEFRMPAGFLEGNLDGQAWVFDFLRHAFVRISEPGGERTEIDLPRQEIPAGTVRGGMSLLSNTVRTARLGHEIVIPWSTGTMSEGVAAYHLSLMKAHLAALDPGTGSVRQIVSLGDALEDPSDDFTALDGGFPLWYRLWGVCGDRVRVYDRVRNQLRGFTASGDEVDAVELPPPPFTGVTPHQFALAVFPLRQAEVTGAVGERMSEADSVRLLNRMAQGFTASPSELAAYLPLYVDFRCSSDGTMWLQPLDPDIGALKGARTWLRLTPDGDVRRVQFPERFDPMRFSPDRIWGIQRDELDVASVAWIDLSQDLP